MKKIAVPGIFKPPIFFFKQKTAYEIGVRLVGSEMCIRDSPLLVADQRFPKRYNTCTLP